MKLSSKRKSLFLLLLTALVCVASFFAGISLSQQPSTVSAATTATVYDIGELGAAKKEGASGSTVNLGALPETVTSSSNVGIKFNISVTLGPNKGLKIGAFRSSSSNAWASGGQMVHLFSRYANDTWDYWLEICDPSNNDSIIARTGLGIGVSDLSELITFEGEMSIVLENSTLSVNFVREGTTYTVSTTTIASTWGQNFPTYADNSSYTTDTTLAPATVTDIEDLTGSAVSTSSGGSAICSLGTDTVENLGVKFTYTPSGSGQVKLGVFKSEQNNVWSGAGYILWFSDIANQQFNMLGCISGNAETQVGMNNISIASELADGKAVFEISVTSTATGYTLHIVVDGTEKVTYSTTTSNIPLGKYFNIYNEGSATGVFSTTNNFTYATVSSMNDLSVINTGTTEIAGASAGTTYIGGLGADVANKGVMYKLSTPAQSGIVKLGLFKAAGTNVWGGTTDGYILQYYASTSQVRLCNGNNDNLTDKISLSSGLEHTVEAYNVTRYNNGVADGYHKLVVKIDGAEVISYQSNSIVLGGEFNGYGEGTEYTVLTTNKTAFDMNVTVNGNGSVTGGNGVYEGDTVEFTITPDVLYQIASVTVDGVDVTANVVDGKLSVASVKETTAVVVTFSAISYSVSDLGDLGVEAVVLAEDKGTDIVNLSSNVNTGIKFKMTTPAIGANKQLRIGAFNTSAGNIWNNGYIFRIMANWTQYGDWTPRFSICDGDTPLVTANHTASEGEELVVEIFTVSGNVYVKITWDGGSEVISTAATKTLGTYFGSYNALGISDCVTIGTTYTYTYAEATVYDVWNLSGSSSSMVGASAGNTSFGALSSAMNSGVVFALQTPAQSGVIKLGLYKTVDNPWGGATNGYLLQYNAGASTMQLCNGDNGELGDAVAIDAALVRLVEISLVERYKDGVADGYSKLTVKVDEKEIISYVSNAMSFGTKFNGYGDGTTYTVATTLDIPTATMYDVAELSEGKAVNNYEAGNSHRLGSLPTGVNEGVNLRISYPTVEGWVVIGLYRENADFNSGDAKGYTLWIYRNSETNLSIKLKSGYDTQVVDLLENGVYDTAFGEYIDLEIYALENPNGSHTLYIGIEGAVRGSYASSEVSLGTWFNIHNQLSASIKAQTAYGQITLEGAGASSSSFVENAYVLPMATEQSGKIFLGWTATENDYSSIYPVGYAYEVTADVTLYAAWLNVSDFYMQEGAAVRLKAGESGIRFKTDITASVYNSLPIAEIGAIIAPTAKLGDKALTFTNFPEAVKAKVEEVNGNGGWLVTGAEEATWTYVAALIDIPQTQYNRTVSARGYIVLNYANGTQGYIYTDYVEENHARNIYEVAVEAKNDTENPWYAKNSIVLGYVNGVADIVIDNNLNVSSTGEGAYSVTSSQSGSTVTLTLDTAVYALTVNGHRVNLSNEPAIEIGGKLYVISNYSLSDTNTQISFDITEGQYLATPMLSYGDGYTVTWTEVENAAYYVVSDSNSHTGDIRVEAGETLAYTPVVVGDHTVSVTAYPADEATNLFVSETASIPSVTVKPVWAYQSVRDGYFWFTAAQMSAAGLDTNSYTLDAVSNKYKVYVKADGTYTPNASEARNWATAEHIGTLLDMQKALGLNVVLLENMGGQFNENDVWANSATKVVMDAAWARGMKVLVADSYIHDFASNERGGTEGSLLTSTSDVAAKIEARLADGTEASNYVKHDAFYGFMLADEPTTGDMMLSLGATVNALKTATAKLRTDMVPFMHAGLTIAYSQNFTGLSAYKSYLKEWIDGAGCDYVCFNMYTDSVMEYGYVYQDRYSSTYQAIMEVAAGYDNVGVYQTLTAFNYNDQENLESKDVYTSMLYAAAFGNDGIAWFNFFPIIEDSANSSNTIVDFAGNANGTYAWVKGANEQFVKLQGLLKGYELSGYQFTDKSTIKKNFISSVNYYRSATTTFTNGDGATVTMKVNAVTQSSGLGYNGNSTLSTTVTQKVENGKTYYVFGVNGVKSGVGTGANVTIAQGEAIVIFN